jgi:two-component system, OmpR family, response regulator
MVTEAAEAPIKVLLIEDDERLAQLTARYLESHGLFVRVAGDGAEGMRESGQSRSDVVLLDLNLPGIDVVEVCRRLRQRSDVPIIMLTARVEEADRVVGLDAGADDYVSKPYSSRELLSRVRAVVRRARGRAGPPQEVRQVGSLAIDASRLRVTLAGREIPLTAYEFAVLYALAERAGRVMSREQLLDLAKGNADDAFDRSIDGHVSRLRHKLGDDARRPRLLKTIRGVGYVLTPDDE